MKASPWTTHSSEITFQNPWFKVRTSRVTTPGGRPGIYGVIEIPPAVGIVAMNDHQQFCLIREYRYPHQQWMWQLPTGAIDDSDATPLDAARRELLQETGYTSEDWTLIGAVHGIKGLTNQVLHTYLARGIVSGEAGIEHDEGIDGSRFITMREFFTEVREGIITDGETIASVATTAAHLELL